ILHALDHAFLRSLVFLSRRNRRVSVRHSRTHTCTGAACLVDAGTLARLPGIDGGRLRLDLPAVGLWRRHLGAGLVHGADVADCPNADTLGRRLRRDHDLHPQPARPHTSEECRRPGMAVDHSAPSWVYSYRPEIWNLLRALCAG